jgi:transcriptional regulator with XRE-family HTH domain
MTCNLKSLLKDRGWSQCLFAKMVSLTDSHLSRIALATILPRLNTAERIAQSLGVTVIDIWPDYLTLISSRSARMSIVRRRRSPEQTAKRKVQQALAGNKRETKVSITAENVMPIADGGGGQDFRLKLCAAPDADIADEDWCRGKAAQLHAYMLRNLAYGCYKELRRMLAAEQTMLDARGLRVVEPRS